MGLVFSDSHIHIAQVDRWAPLGNSPVCAASHTREEFERIQAIARKAGSPVLLCFGLHPQAADLSLAPFLENLLLGNKIHAIGEAGFDAFTPEYRASLPAQTHAWRLQVDFAARFQKPLVIHCRKALPLIFADAGLLRNVPACVFHSFPGSPLEAASLLKRGVNGFFSFGKPLLNNNKRSRACAAELPFERILAETDAPFQRLKGEAATLPEDIVGVHKAIAGLRGKTLEETAETLAGNFRAAYFSSRASM
jgi:TatD DNase family protein